MTTAVTIDESMPFRFVSYAMMQLSDGLPDEQLALSALALEQAIYNKQKAWTSSDTSVVAQAFAKGFNEGVLEAQALRGTGSQPVEADDLPKSNADLINLFNNAADQEFCDTLRMSEVQSLKELESTFAIVYERAQQLYLTIYGAPA